MTALLRTAKENGLDLKVVRAVEEANERQKGVLVDKVLKKFGNDLKGRRFALWGLAFKPNTDDMREAPSLVIVERLLKAGATVSAFDPVAMEEAERGYKGEGRITFAGTAMQAVQGADALLIATEWKAFRSPDFDALKAGLKAPVIFDGRNLYEPAVVRAKGFEYYPIGR